MWSEWFIWNTGQWKIKTGRSAVGKPWRAFQCQNEGSGLPSISNGSHWGFVSRKYLPLSHIIQWPRIAVACSFTDCHTICQNELFAFLHLVCFSSKYSWFRDPISESPGQTPAWIPIAHLKSPKPKPFSGWGENPVPRRIFPDEVYFLFPERWLGSPREPGWRILEFFQAVYSKLLSLWTQLLWKQARSWPRHPAPGFDLRLSRPLMSVFQSQP